MKVNDERAILTKSDINVDHPRLIQDAMIMKQQSEGVFIAGGTLIQLNWEAGLTPSTNLINLETICELKGIEHVEQNGQSFIKVRALTTIAECLENSMILEYAPLLIEACKSIAAPAVRNRATLGGNVASGIGDSIPVLLVLDAELTIRIKNKTKTLKLWEWLQIQRETPQSSFLLIDIHIPFQRKGDQAFFKKVGRRDAFTPALITISAQWRKRSDNELNYIRIAIGGGNNYPSRLIIVEKLLETNSFNETFLQSIYPEILDEFISYSDPFVSESYRKQVVANLLVAELMNIFPRGEDEEK
jgi:xanthine dehydrogenase C subunit